VADDRAKGMWGEPQMGSRWKEGTNLFRCLSDAGTMVHMYTIDYLAIRLALQGMIGGTTRHAPPPGELCSGD
jgi:hypothetical protein